MNETTSKPMKQGMAIVVGVIIGLLSGVGATQVWIVGDVRRHEVMLESQATRLAESRADFETRLQNVIKLWEAQLATERELIMLVREQNRLLQNK